MPLPTRTPEQLRAALAIAAENRKRRAALLQRIRRGEINLTELFWMADRGDELVANTRVLSALAAVPGVSRSRARVFLQDAQIAEHRKIRGTGTRQRTELVKLIGG